MFLEKSLVLILRASVVMTNPSSSTWRIGRTSVTLSLILAKALVLSSNVYAETFKDPVIKNWLVLQIHEHICKLTTSKAMASAIVSKSYEIVHKGRMWGVEFNSWARINALRFKRHRSGIDAEERGSSNDCISDFAYNHFVSILCIQ